MNFSSSFCQGISNGNDHLPSGMVLQVNDGSLIVSGHIGDGVWLGLSYYVDLSDQLNMGIYRIICHEFWQCTLW